MITKDELKQRNLEMQEEIFDEFFKGLRLSLHPNDEHMDDGLRAHVLNVAAIHISQMNYQMNELLTMCQPPTGEKATNDQKATTPGEGATPQRESKAKWVPTLRCGTQRTAD